MTKTEKTYRVTDPSYGDDVEITFNEFVDGCKVAGYEYSAEETIRHGCDVIVIDGKIVAYEISDYEAADTIYS